MEGFAGATSFFLYIYPGLRRGHRKRTIAGSRFLTAFVISASGTDRDQVHHPGFVLRMDGDEREDSSADIERCTG